MVTALDVDGVDLSHWNKGPNNRGLDFTAAKKAGLRWVYHKVSEGATNLDPTYPERRQMADHYRLPFGAYHFAHPEPGDALKEARFFLRHAKIQPGDLVPMLDLEVNEHQMTQDQLTKWVATFVREVRRQLKVTPIIYTKYHLNHNFGAMLWMARYNKTNIEPVPVKPWKRWDIWQFSGGVDTQGTPGQIAGLGHVDLNVMREGVRISDFRIPIPGPTPDEKKQTGIFRLTTQNVKAFPLMPQVKVVEDVQMTAKDSGIIGWQEIGPDRYQDAVRELPTDKWAHFFGQKTDGPTARGYESPISWRKKYWKFVDGGKWKFYEGTATVAKTKWLTWVILEHRKTGARVMVNNVHYIAGAWSHDPKPNDAEREREWLEMNRKHKAWLIEFMKKYPEVAIACLGDYNWPFARKGEPLGKTLNKRKVIYAVKPLTIDFICLINGTKFKWVVEDFSNLPGRNSDHSGRRAEVRLAA